MIFLFLNRNRGSCPVLRSPVMRFLSGGHLLVPLPPNVEKQQQPVELWGKAVPELPAPC
jgi:hypothetical protein